MTLVDRPTEGAAPSYALTDRYRLRSGRAFMSGVQALARIPIEQLRVDRDAGLNTAAFISGYQGSPLGGFDQEVARAARLLPDLPIVCRPAVNEELGATAVMGSQLAAEQPDARYDGVVGIWYGKAPGLDRASDALRHAAFAGTSRHGGAVALVGDDPAAKSSTLPSSSDATLVDLHMPILYPGNVQEVLDLGLHAIALSRLTGAWSAMKIVAAVADGTSTVDLSSGRVVPVVPDLVPPGSTDGLDYVHHPDANLLAPRTLELERDFRLVRSELIRRYAAVNGLNHPSVDPGDAWIGLISSGYTYHQLRDALRRVGFTTDDEIAAAGIRLLQMQMPVTFDPEVVRRFSRGLSEVVVVEEKNPTLELLVKDALYSLAERPAVYGKRHPDGRTLMTETGMLDADAMVDGLRERLAQRLESRMTPVAPPERERVLIPLLPSGSEVDIEDAEGAAIDIARTPFFCSGCPHNRSTRTPEGSLVGAGIGCHTMVLLMDDERLGDISGITAMGGEGAQWIGMSPFIERTHFLQNLGDGTFFHSGQLAIQAAVAAGVDITYKLLYNGTVAMTGGQDAVGGVGVPQIVTALVAHGVSDILVTTEDRSRYDGVDLGAGPNGAIQVWDRTRLEEAQERLAATKGVTVLINDQACAAHTRQLRKRGQLPTPELRVAINHRICEACGDCGVVSNCLSVQAVETPLGVKTTIDQDSCNLDLSCIEGDCPAFMTIEPGDPEARRSGTTATLPDDDLPAPPTLATVPWSVRLTGIGGTGVVTTSQILGTAAMLDGLEVQGLDQTGLSQKAGPVVSDLRITSGEPAPTNSIGMAGCDAIIALDLLVAATDKMLAVADPAHTRLVGSSSETPTGSMVGHPETPYPEIAALRSRLARSVHSDPLLVDAAGWCRELLGSAAGANIFMVGVAVQDGLLPIGPDRIEAAIELNGVAVAANLAAFRWGRWWVADPSRLGAPSGSVDHHTMHVPALPAKLGRRIDSLASSEGVSDLLRLLAADLVGYQSEAYATRFLDRVDAALAAERRVDPSAEGFTEATARSLHQFMAYKDEYEVARLLLGPEGAATAEIVGGPGAAVTWKLHPPTLSALGMGRKLSVPGRVGRPAMQVLARGKRLRGTAADPFGRTEVRRTERRILAELESAIDLVTQRLAADPSAERLTAATAVVALARSVRGYERLKLERAATFSRELAAALAAF